MSTYGQAGKTYGVAGGLYGNASGGTIAPVDIPATLTVSNLLNDVLIVAGVQFAPLEVGKVIQMAGRGVGNKCDLYLALFGAEGAGHVNAGELPRLVGAVPSGHTLYGGHTLTGGQNPVRTVTPE